MPGQIVVGLNGRLFTRGDLTGLEARDDHGDANVTRAKLTVGTKALAKGPRMKGRNVLTASRHRQQEYRDPESDED